MLTRSSSPDIPLAMEYRDKTLEALSPRPLQPPAIADGQYSAALESRYVTTSLHYLLLVKHSVADHPPLLSRRDPGHGLSKTEFIKQGEILRVLNPNMVFNIAKKGLERSTTGVIASATGQGIKTAAVSGWLPNPGRGPNVLDSSKYFGLVRSFARVLDFRLMRNVLRDLNPEDLPEHDGRFVQSHAVRRPETHVTSCHANQYSGEEACCLLGHRRSQSDARHHEFDKDPRAEEDSHGRRMEGGVDFA